MEQALSYAIQIEPRALAEAQAAAAEYEEFRPGHRTLYLLEIDHLIGLLATAPKLHQRVHGEIRRAPLRRFPYQMFYRVDDATRVVHVIGCTPDRADPEAILAEVSTRYS